MSLNEELFYVYLFLDESQNHLITSADLQVKLEVDDNHHQELDDEDYSDFMLHPESGQDFKLEDDQGQVDLVAESRSTGYGIKWLYLHKLN